MYKNAKEEEECKMRKWLKSKGVMLTLAVALAVGAPLSVVQNPVEVSAKAVKKGLKKEKGKFYFYEKGKKIKNQWKTVGKKKYYFKNDGAAAVGWNKIGKKAYYFDDKAVMVKKKTVHKVKLNAKGEAALSARAKLMIKAQSVADKQAKPTQSKAKKLQACYKYVMKCGYAGKFESTDKAGWEVKYAQDMLQTKKGNCYSSASAFAMLAKVCGYDAKIVKGEMTINGNKVPHAWVEIGGKVYDPQAQKDKGFDLYGKTYKSISQIKYTVKKRV